MFFGRILCLLLWLSAGCVAALGQILPIVPPLECRILAAPPTVIRAEGVSERIGDILIACTGGTPTQIGAIIPIFNIRLFFNTNVTSRLLTSAAAGSSFSEALLLIDEPNSPGNAQTPLRLCGDANTNEFPNNPGVCRMFGTLDENTYSGANPDSGISSNNRPNVFQARQVAANAIEFAGVPIDPRLPLFSGRFAQRILRITNVRVNPAFLGDPNSFVPKQITTFVSMTGARENIQSQTVAYILPGIQTAVETLSKPLQCEARNAMQTAFTVRMTEAFPSSFKQVNSAQDDATATSYPTTFANQNIPGASYETEDGFINTTSALGRAYGDPRGEAFPAVRGMRNAGAADSGTRLSVQIRDVPRGVQIWVPGVLTVRSKISGLATGRAVLIANEGPFSPVKTNADGLAQIALSATGATAVYEVLYADPFNSEWLEVPVAVVYEAGSPEAGIQSTLTAGFIARDATRSPSYDAFAIETCDCNLLFPVVTNRNGYDTGVAISNTGPDEGKVTLHYFCGTEDCSSPANQTTAEPIAAGKQLTFTLSGGGGNGIEPVAGFQGYIVARTQFRYCHGFAFLSALNAIATNNGASTGYLALVMDRAAFRDGVSLSESLGH